MSLLNNICSGSSREDEECSRKCSTSDVPEVSAVQGAM